MSLNCFLSAFVLVCSVFLCKSSSPNLFPAQHINSDFNEANMPDHIQWLKMEQLPKASALRYTTDVLYRVAAINKLNKKLEGRRSNFAETMSEETEFDVTNLIEKILSRTLNIKNITLFIALYYCDQIAEILFEFLTPYSTKRIFAGCLSVAARIHTHDISRETLGELFDLTESEMLTIESAVVDNVKDLSLNVNKLKVYFKRLIYPNHHRGLIK